MQSSYLSRIPQIIFVEKKYVMWRNLKFLSITDVQISKISPHMEKFQMSPHDTCGKNLKFSTSGMCLMQKTLPYMQNICHFLEKKINFVKMYSLCREIHFVAIHGLLCGEKFIQKLSSWRKNDKYEVWLLVEVALCAVK